MAISTPRFIFACSIPTIIVILSYIWFKKKKETDDFRSSDSSFSCDKSGLNNCLESSEVEEKEEVVVVVKQNTTSSEYRIVETNVTETDIVSVSPSSGSDRERSLREIESELGDVTIVSLNDNEVVTDQIVEMVYGTTADQVGDRYSESDKDVLKATCRENESTCNSPSSDRSEETTVTKQSSTTEDVVVVVKCNGSSDAELENRQNELQSEITENVKELRLSSSSPPPQRESCGNDVVVVPDHNDDDDTLIDENVESVDTTVIVVSTPQQEETHRSLRNDETSDVSVRRRSPTESENDVTIVTTTSVTIVDHPPVVSSPGSINDDQELQKLTNGTDTSAYGSASHSPAEELLESPTASNFSDMHSEGSSDSGKGCSEINATSADSSNSSVYPFTPLSVFEFELPQDLCGRLIGQKGRYVNFIKSKSKANISIKRHPFNAELKLCAVIGTEEDINNALILIRKRFPINRFPLISMIQVNAPLLNNVPIPDTLQLHLPEGVTCDVIMSSLVNAGHFFIQQPTHPTYSSLGRLDQCMLHCYLNGMGAPELPKAVEPGVICSASTMGGWYRAQIVFVHSETEECEIRFVDYGGYLQTPISSLRQIRSDFMTLPFQASECYLANVVPIDETQGWTPEATSMFEELAQGQILQAQIVSYSDDGIPYVHIYRIQGVMTTFVNRELVDCGLAKWIEHQT